MHRPKPWPAPVTATVLLSKRMFMVSPRWVVVAEAIPRPAWRDEREGVRSRFVGGFYTAERYEAAPDCLAKAQRVETSLLNRFVTE
jgi:hypothetical protein